MTAAAGGLFGSAAYLEASARHDGGTPDTLVLGGVQLPVVVEPGGALHTPYGYPQPTGDTSAEALSAAAELAARHPRPWRLALAPVGAGEAFAAALAAHAPAVSSRPIAVHDFDGGDPVERFKGETRTMVRRALRSGARVESGPVTPAFGALYRAAMDALAAPAHYRFDDTYLLALDGAGAVQWELHDAHGLAAAALFLVVGEEATYHLSARRRTPDPPPGAANLLIAEGLRHCRDAGAELCYLGGGRSGAADDPLLRFKRTMATRIVDRPTFEHAP
ncbi:hypothetical protein C8N24_2753 [Solirubrobacter pauli]|uniref:Acetyltransferase (GNAT) family protein n=1 Tax=Solirubrobacter pauli TaxID=166793 RepID=A0A660LCX3_9ACTN|nr:hypothetical protein [Solirubrobacter pauli]RKQ92897.1 hypothetical protein C8N24_2753 [Solirubrobacter pauli]